MTAHQEGGHMMNLEDQYDRIFKYLYFHFRDRHVAEDMTQEAFLRFLESWTYCFILQANCS